jgi:hypothetical protein
MKDLIENFRGKENIIDIYDWMVEDGSLINFREKVFAVRNTFNELKSIDSSLGIDYSDIVIDTFIREVNRDFNLAILEELYKSGKNDFLDFTTSVDDFSELEQVIIQSGYKNFVGSGSLISKLRLSQNYIMGPDDNLNRTGIMVRDGKLGDVNLWINATGNWKDNKVCLFDFVRINIGEVKIWEEWSESDLSSQIKVSYQYDFEVDDSKVIFVIHDEKSEGYHLYKSSLRIGNIDNILK